MLRPSANWLDRLCWNFVYFQLQITIKFLRKILLGLKNLRFFKFLLSPRNYAVMVIHQRTNYLKSNKKWSEKIKTDLIIATSSLASSSVPPSSMTLSEHICSALFSSGIASLYLPRIASVLPALYVSSYVFSSNWGSSDVYEISFLYLNMGIK